MYTHKMTSSLQQDNTLKKWKGSIIFPWDSLQGGVKLKNKHSALAHVGKRLSRVESLFIDNLLGYFDFIGSLLF